MSVRSSLQTDTGTSIGLNRHQLVSPGSSTTAKGAMRRFAGTTELKFHDSLHEHISSLDPEEATSEGLNSEMNAVANSSLSMAITTDAADGAHSDHSSAFVTADPRQADAIPKKQGKKNHAQLVAIAAAQRKLLRIREHKPALTETAKGVERPDAAESKTERVTLASPPEAIEIPGTAGASLAPTQNGSMPPDSVASSDLAESSSTTLSLSSFQVGEDPSSSWSASKVKMAQGPVPDTSSANSGTHSAITPADRSNLDQESANDASKQSGKDRSVAVQLGNLPSSSRLNDGGLQQDESTPMLEVSSKTGSDPRSNRDPSIQGTTFQTNKMSLNSQPPSKRELDDQLPALRRSDIENGGFNSPPSDAASFSSVREVITPADSKASSFQNPSWTEAVGSNKVPSRTHLASRESRARQMKQVLLNPSDSFNPHALDASRTAEVANAGIAPQKTTGAISGNTRLEETFTALDSGERSESSTVSWTRTGHMGAEAGYRDPVLGWIGVRVDANASGVHATLVPQSSDAAQVLSGHLDGLHSYLVDNRTPVDTLTLASSASDGHQFAAQDTGQGTHQGAGQNGGQQHAPKSALEPQSIAPASRGSAVRGTLTQGEVFTRRDSSAGTYISVLA
jgi:hypothetical protein